MLDTPVELSTHTVSRTSALARVLGSDLANARSELQSLSQACADTRIALQSVMRDWLERMNAMAAHASIVRDNAETAALAAQRAAATAQVASGRILLIENEPLAEPLPLNSESDAVPATETEATDTDANEPVTVGLTSAGNIRPRSRSRNRHRPRGFGSAIDWLGPEDPS